MHRIVVFLMLPFLFNACKNSSHDKTHLKIVLSGLEDATTVLAHSTNNYLNEMQNRTKDPHKAEKANMILPRMEILDSSVKKVNDIIDAYVEKIADSGAMFNNDYSDLGLIKELFSVLHLFRSQILKTDDEVTELFEKRRFEWAASFPSEHQDLNNYSKSTFTNKDAEDVLLYLYTLRMDLRIIENKIMEFCLYKYDSNFCGIYKTSFLVGINSQKVKTSTDVEIQAGMGYFSINNVQKIEIDNVEVPLADDGIATYRFNAGKKAGKMKKLVKVYYLDDYGDSKVQSRSVEYEVTD
jgi:hypothetical protein